MHPGRGRARDKRVPLFLNVYDLLEHNKYGYAVGLGAFHSGVEIYGTEYSFGGHDVPDVTGVFDVRPRTAQALRFRESIALGECALSQEEVDAIVEELSTDWMGLSYHSLHRNCNHFSDELCRRLIGRGVPGWVNRLAYIGTLVKCLLPQSIYLPAPSASAEEIESHSHSHNHDHASHPHRDPFPGEGHSLLQHDSLLESYEAAQVSSETLRERVRLAAEKRARPAETV